MLLKDKIKWYAVISTCVFLSVSIYMGTAYVFSDLELHRLLGYSRFTAGVAAVTFWLLFWLKPRAVKFRIEWFGFVAACLFLLISTYMQMTVAFSDARVGRTLHQLEITTALSALVFGVFSFPKWQSFFALAVWVYSFYRFAQPAFALS